MKNQKGFYLLEVTVSLFSASLLLLSALHIYGAISLQINQAVYSWGLFWDMKKSALEWKEGMMPEGQYQFKEYQVEIQERAISQSLKEGEIIFRWESSDIPQEKKIYAYRMDKP